MTKTKRKILCALIFFLAPFLFIKGVKSHLGDLSEVPKARRKGDSRATVLIIEYSDFQCPACARTQPTVRRLMKKYEGQVQMVFKHFPLTSIHKNAMIAHHAAECAAAQNKFWPFHDRLFDDQKLWSQLEDPTAQFFVFAKEMELDEKKFDSCLADSSRLIPIQYDKREGRKVQVRSTPTYFVGKKRMVGNVFITQASRAIERELKK